MSELEEQRRLVHARIEAAREAAELYKEMVENVVQEHGLEVLSRPGLLLDATFVLGNLGSASMLIDPTSRVHVERG